MTPPLVLAYHGLADLPYELDPDGLLVPPAAFRAHVERLRRRGYRFVKQAELARRLGAGEAIDGLCSLTFDDAPEDNVRLPALLEELDAAATVYACPGLLGEPYPFVESGAGVRIVTREELLELGGHPRVEIGSHTMDHRNLGEAGADEAYREMVQSKEALEDMLGHSVISFAYPYCDYSPDCPDAARRAGYTSAVTCGERGGWEPFALTRQSPSPGDGRLTFELKSRGLFFRVRRSPPARLARRVLRPLRYR